MEPISIVPSNVNVEENNNDQPISISPPVDIAPPLSPERVAQKATQAQLATEGTKAELPAATFSDYFSTQREAPIRRQAAAALNDEVAQRRLDMVRNAIANGASTEDLQWIQGFDAQPYKEATVFDRRAGEVPFEELNKFAQKEGDDHYWNLAQQFPEAKTDVDLLKQYGSTNFGKWRFMANLAQDLEDMIGKQSTAGRWADTGKMLFPIFNPYMELKSRGNIPGVGWGEGILAGPNKEAQRNALWNQPFEQFTETTRNFVMNLAKDNPQQALSFLKDMMGQTSFEKGMDSLGTVGTILDVTQLSKSGFQFARAGYALNQARRAIKDIMVSARDLDATKADILASVGDLNGAAINDAARLFTSRIQGSTTVTQEGLEQLGRFFRIDRANIGKDASLSETQKNILMNEIDTREASILKALTSMVRPDRIPLEKATPELLKDLSEQAVGRYPGMKNAVLHISDPVREPLTTSWNVTAWIGRKTGEFFDSPLEATNYAVNHGLRVSLGKDQLALIEGRITDLQEIIKHPPRMEDDGFALNKYYSAEKELKGLTELKGQFAESGGYRIKDTNGGHYIELTTNVPENTKLIRAFLDNRPETALPGQGRFDKAFGNWLPFWPKLRTAEDTVSEEHRAMRKAAVYPQAVLRELAAQEAKYITDVAKGAIKFDPTTGTALPAWQRMRVPFVSKALHKQEWRDFLQTLKFSQDDIAEDGVQGNYFKSHDELNNFYLKTFDRTPTWSESQAYFAVKRWNEFDRILREIGSFRNKAMAGAETHELVAVRDGQKVKSAAFDAVPMAHFLKGATDTKFIAIVDDSFENARVSSLAKMTNKERDQFALDVKNGQYKMLQLYDKERLPFKDLFPGGENHIEYVLAKNTEQRPLTWEQVPNRGGGHQVFDYGHYVKQANIVTEIVDGHKVHRYLGDNTAMPVAYSKMGQDMAEKMSVVRKLVKDGKDDEAKLFTELHLPWSWKDLSADFKGTRLADGTKIPPRFNLNEDFKVVPRGTALIDLNNELRGRYGLNTPNGGVFEDGTKQGLARNFQIEFTGERDSRGMFTVENKGTVQQPVYNLQPAEKVAPLEVLTRSMNKIINSTSMDDYKMYAVKNWLEQAKPYMKEKENVIDSAPFYHFKTANEQSFVSGFQKENPLLMQQMLANKFKVDQLVGTPTPLQSFLHSWSEMAADSLYSKFGPTGAKMVPIWLVDKLKDPFAIMRSIAFNANLGFFAIPQLWVQAASFVNIFGHSPRYAASGTIASLLHGWSGLNQTPEFLKMLDGIAVKASKMPGMIHWRDGEFLEAVSAMNKAGFNKVGQEYAALDRVHSARLIKGVGGEFLDWGQVFFRKGEQATRIGAWFTAFKEFREAQPLAKLTNTTMTKIMDRADLLYGNMSSASNSALHTGILSLPTQFYAYTIRLAEQFWSKRIGETVLERSMVRGRLLATNAAMFGVPMASGITGLPVADYFREKVLGTGLYNVNQAQQSGQTKDWVSHFLMEGLPATLISMATGENYNVGPRYGSSGFNAIKDGLYGDKPMWQLLGAAPTGLYNTVFGPNKDGLVHSMSALISGDPLYKPKVDDVLDIFKDLVRSVPRTHQLIMALNTGKFVSNNSDQVKDVNKLSALFMYMSGLSPQEQADARHTNINIKDLHQNQLDGIKAVRIEVNRWLLAKNAKNDTQADDYYRRAQAVGIAHGLDSKQLSSAIAGALKGQGNLIERTSFEAVQKAPLDKKLRMQQMYKDISGARK